MAFVDWKDQKQAQEYLDQIGIEYRFQCYGEKMKEGCHRLGDYLESMKGDFSRARKVYKMNCFDARYGHGHSCFKYGQYNLVGKGGIRNLEKAHEAYAKGCDFGFGPSCGNAGLMHQEGLIEDQNRDFVKAQSFLQRGCDLHDPQCCHQLSGYYITGKPGVERNMEKAFACALKACDKFYYPACVNTTLMYRKGEGVAANEELAKKYEQRSKELYEGQ